MLVITYVSTTHLTKHTSHITQRTAHSTHLTTHTAIAYLDVVVSAAAAGEAADELFDVDDVVVVAVHGGEKA